MTPRPRGKRIDHTGGYHHGDLRESLIRATEEIVAAEGVEGFSVAEAARRCGVSSGAPFRHFEDRDALLAAVGARATERLRDDFIAALAEHEDPVEQLAAVSAAFVAYAIRDPAGFALTHGPRFGFRDRLEMLVARRELVDLLVPLGLELAPDIDSALELIGTQLALSNGLAVLAARGGFEGRGDDVPAVEARARRAMRALVAGWDES